MSENHAPRRLKPEELIEFRETVDAQFDILKEVMMDSVSSHCNFEYYNTLLRAIKHLTEYSGCLGQLYKHARKEEDERSESNG